MSKAVIDAAEAAGRNAPAARAERSLLFGSGNPAANDTLGSPVDLSNRENDRKGGGQLSRRKDNMSLI